MDAYFPIHLPYGLSPLHRYCQATGRGVALPYRETIEGIGAGALDGRLDGKSDGKGDGKLDGKIEGAGTRTPRFLTPTLEELRRWYNPDLRPLFRVGSYGTLGNEEGGFDEDWVDRARKIGEEIRESLVMMKKEEVIVVTSGDEGEGGVLIRKEKRQKTSCHYERDPSSSSTRPSTRPPSTLRSIPIPSNRNPAIIPPSPTRELPENLPRSASIHAFRRASTNQFGFHIKKNNASSQSRRSQTCNSRASPKSRQKNSAQNETTTFRPKPKKRRAESEESSDSVIFVGEWKASHRQNEKTKAVSSYAKSRSSTSISLPISFDGANQLNGGTVDQTMAFKSDPNFTLNDIPDFDIRRKVSRLRAVDPDSSVSRLYALLMQSGGSYETALGKVTLLARSSSTPYVQDKTTNIQPTPSRHAVRTTPIPVALESEEDEPKIRIKFEPSFFYDTDDGEGDNDRPLVPPKAGGAKQTLKGVVSTGKTPSGKILAGKIPIGKRSNGKTPTRKMPTRIPPRKSPQVAGATPRQTASKAYCQRANDLPQSPTPPPPPRQAWPLVTSSLPTDAHPQESSPVVRTKPRRTGGGKGSEGANDSSSPQPQSLSLASLSSFINIHPYKLPAVVRKKPRRIGRTKDVGSANDSSPPPQRLWSPYPPAPPTANTGKKRSLPTQSRQEHDLEDFVIPDEYPMVDPDGDFSGHATTSSESSDEWEI
ncbi:hypothetical protein P154DRAFT_571953 [Amniculicola lignicola CBS 123094]|uniref:Uncharacterized protein n=1 Tax=Amniculicola lignicola CBS 123094 TaxID=1392246 RepID=A0A6A5WSC3_9PLEO|nr:hypothetical protein P154DRAFT_571953 [Amniculicola lignicola CBS 123094]